MVELAPKDAADTMKAIAVVRGDKRLGYMSLASTMDADGQPVETSTAIEANRVVISVRHRDADLRYPLLVDPTVWEDYRDGYLSNMAGWSFAANVAGKFGAAQWPTTPAGYGLYISAPQNTAFTAGNAGYWYWTAPANT